MAIIAVAAVGRLPNLSASQRPASRPAKPKSAATTTIAAVTTPERLRMFCA